MRKVFAGLSLGIILVACGERGSPSGALPPNVLLVIADDFGLDASPCHPSVGAMKPDMPNLAKLCDSGVVFEHAWAHPTCTPTRAALLTGRFGIRTNVLAVDEILSPTPTILQRVQEAATPYATAVIGKWHVSGARADANAPASFGAQHYAGFLSGALTDYFNWTMIVDGISERQTGYATTVLTDEAVAWVGAALPPWLLWVAYNAPHAPFHVPPETLYSQPRLKNGTATDNRTKYFAAAEALDAEFGRLVSAIPPAALANTIIIFMGDNGTPGQVAQPPYSAASAKESLYQGGINVPLVVSGAGVVTGARSQALIGDTDLFATVQELTGSTGDVPIDSVSYAEIVRGAGETKRTHAYVDFRQNGQISTAIRDRQYKLIENGDGAKALYDLAVDPYETHDLLNDSNAAQYEAVVGGLTAARQELQR